MFTGLSTDADWCPVLWVMAADICSNIPGVKDDFESFCSTWKVTLFLPPDQNKACGSSGSAAYSSDWSLTLIWCFCVLVGGRTACYCCQTFIVPEESSVQSKTCPAVNVVMYGLVRSMLFTSDLFTYSFFNLRFCVYFLLSHTYTLSVWLPSCLFWSLSQVPHLPVFYLCLHLSPGPRCLCPGLLYLRCALPPSRVGSVLPVQQLCLEF